MTTASWSPDDELRILHWNVHSWRDDAGETNLPVVARLIRATDPHVVSLVEVDESWDGPSLLDELAVDTGYSTVFVPTFEFGRDRPAGGFGNALLSRLPILAVRQRQLTWPATLYDGSEPSEPRSVLLARFQAPAGPVWVGSTHLPRGDGEARTDALQRLKAMVQELPEPWLLVGDFNVPAPAWLEEHDSLRAYPAAEATYPAKEPVEAIDYAVAPSGLEVEAKVFDRSGSDHLPVLIRRGRLRISRSESIEPTWPTTNVR